MARVRASMADVSTEFQPIEPGVYEMEVVSVAEQVADDDRVTYAVRSKVVEMGEFFGRNIYDNINIHKKDGSLNEYALADLKRYFEAIAPDMADDEDADTDALIGGRFQAEVVIETYERSEAKGGGTATANRINRRSIQAV